MKSQEFVINKINHLIDLFPEIQLQYVYDTFETSHFIEVLPKETYDSTERYGKEELKITQEFIEKYPYELITFVTQGDLITIDRPIYSRKGFLHNWYKNALNFNFAQIEIFYSHNAVLPEKIDLHLAMRGKFISKFSDINFTASLNNKFFLLEASNANSLPIDIPVGESRFAMAA